jgi:pheromone shutdown-related protein TraB
MDGFMSESPDLSPITELRHGDRVLYLLGTAHVSPQSVADVKNAIEQLRPDSVCVELCQGRYDSLVDETRWRKLDIFQVIREGKALYLLATLGLSAFQRRIGEKLGVRPGAELLAAADAAKANSLPLTLIDRDVHVTLKRTWGALGLWNRSKLLAGVLGGVFAPAEDPSAEEIETLKRQAHLSELLAEFSRALPDVKRPLIDERDQYMISKIREAPGKRVLAVVGAAHVPGMTAQLDANIDRASLEVLPPPSLWESLFKWLFLLAIIVLFFVGWAQKGSESLVDMALAWALPTSVFCAIGTALAAAKPLSVLSGFLAAPLTTLHPLIPAGLVVGLVEAWLRRPTVEDAENVPNDVQSLRGVYRNPVTRVLLAAALSTVGAATGAWVGLGWLFGVAT